MNKLCYRKCEAPYILTDEANKECLDDCRNSSHKTFLKYRDTCVETCPQYAPQQGYECIFSLTLGTVNDNIMSSNITKDELLSMLDDNVNNLLDMNMTIKGDGYYLEVYNSSSPFPESPLTSSLNFSQCESILREKYKIPSTEEIIIAKIDTKDKDTSIIDYKAYTQSGKPLDALPCRAITSGVSTPLTLSEEDIIKGYEMQLKGIDIFNVNDEFYNDICKSYIVGKTDMCLNNRRKIYYNTSIKLCEEGCRYIGINYSTRRVSCNCETKTTLNLTAENANQATSTYLNKIFPHNLATLKCSSLFFKWENVKNSSTFWTGISLSISSVSFALIVYLKSIVTLFNKIDVFIGNSPTTITGYFAGNDYQIEDTKGMLKLTLRALFQQKINFMTRK